MKSSDNSKANHKCGKATSKMITYPAELDVLIIEIKKKMLGLSDSTIHHLAILALAEKLGIDLDEK